MATEAGNGRRGWVAGPAVKIPGPLLEGCFLSRPNRFLTLVELDGRVVRSHLPDPGRLQELLVPGAAVLLRPAGAPSQRSTAYTTVLVKAGRHLVSLVSVLPNRLVAEGLERGELPVLREYTLDKAEVRLGRHRFDFRLRDPRGAPFYLEVKSVTYVQRGVARFPDAVSARAARHAEALADISRRGGGAGILFVCQRPDADSFEPFRERDPGFARSLEAAQAAGVRVWCLTTEVTREEIRCLREIPVRIPGTAPGPGGTLHDHREW